MRFKDLVNEILNEASDNDVMVKRSLKEFFKKHKDEFTNQQAAKRTLGLIDKEDDDVKTINLVGKFFGFLENPEKHEEFIDTTLELL